MPSFLHNTLQPAIYHGFGKQPPFFEGWYYKAVSAAEDHRLAVIPGVIFGEKAHAFIQILDGVIGKSTYHTFPLESFWAARDEFAIRIGGSSFTVEKISLDIADEIAQVSGELRFSGGTPWPVRLLSPGIMGWYAWVPRMECYHGVLSFDHLIQGSLAIDGHEIDFSGGHGYIEKDWGQSFPEAWIWFQSNHFSQPGVCLTASVAMIPWLHNSFRGFIVGLWTGRELYRFATYTGARIDDLHLDDRRVVWVIRDRAHVLELEACQAPGAVLRGPTKIEMGKRVDETLGATVSVRLSHSAGGLIFEGEGKYAGLEINGDLERLLAK